MFKSQQRFTYDSECITLSLRCNFEPRAVENHHKIQNISASVPFHFAGNLELVQFHDRKNELGSVFRLNREILITGNCC